MERHTGAKAATSLGLDPSASAISRIRRSARGVVPQFSSDTESSVTVAAASLTNGSATRPLQTRCISARRDNASSRCACRM